MSFTTPTDRPLSPVQQAAVRAGIATELENYTPEMDVVFQLESLFACVRGLVALVDTLTPAPPEE